MLIRAAFTRLALAAVVMVLGATAISAPTARGVDRWPGKTIRYHSNLHSSYDWSLKAATNAWNSTGLGIRFVRVKKPTQAQFLIRMGPSRGGGAWATLGRQRNARLVVAGRPGRAISRENWIDTATLLTHELGHVLGLPHPATRACTIMNPYPRPCEPSTRTGYYPCRLVRPHDLAQARRLYGGARRTLPRNCLIEPAAPAIRDIRITGGTGTPVVISWTRPTGRIPAGSKIEIRSGISQNCTGNGPSDRLGRVSIDQLPISHTSWTDSREITSAEVRCIEVKTVNYWGLGTAPSRHSVTVTPPPVDAPTVGAITPHMEDGSSPRQYWNVPVALPASSYLAVQRMPDGSCPPTHNAPGAEGVDAYLVPEAGVYRLQFSDPPAGSICLAFFALRDDRASPAVHAMVP